MSYSQHDPAPLPVVCENQLTFNNPSLQHCLGTRLGTSSLVPRPALFSVARLQVMKRWVEPGNEVGYFFMRLYDNVVNQTRYVTGSEKRDLNSHFPGIFNFWRFSNCHISTAIYGSDIILGTIQVITFN